MTNQRPFLLIFFLLILGLTLARLYQAIFGVSLLLAALLPFWLYQEYRGKTRAACYFYLYILGCSYLLGCLISYQPVIPEKSFNLTGKVLEYRPLTSYQRVIVRSPELNSKLALHISNDLVVEPGMWLSFSGTITEPKSARNPGEFSYQDYLAKQGVAGLIIPEQITILKPAKLSSSWVAKLRKYFYDNIQANIKSAELTVALVLGQRTALSPEEQQVWQQLGTSHLLAVSGMHIGLLAILFGSIAQRLSGSNVAKCILVSFLLLIYVLISGGSPSAWRAWGGAVLGLTAAMRKQKIDALHSWSLIGTTMLLISPNLLWQISFQLSFAASGSIILWVPVLNRITKLFKDNLLGRITGYLLNSIMISLIAQIGLFPFLVYYFQEVSLFGPLATLIMVPPIFSLLIGGLMVGLLGPLVKPIGQLMHWLTIAIYQINSWLLKLSPTIQLSGLSFGLVFLWYFLFISGGWILRQNYIFPRQQSNWRWTIQLLCILTVLSLPASVKRPLEITILDVGQGDAIYIRTPYQQHILIDGGGDSIYWQQRGRNVGLRTVVPYLKYRGVKELDLVILSHPHEDHLHGLLAVLETFPVKQVVDNGLSHTTVSYERYLQLIAEKNISYTSVKAGDRIILKGGIVLAVLHPAQPLQGTNSDHNNNSLVLLLDYQGKKVMFTGDLDRAGQIDLLSRESSSIDWIKVPHHGSREALEPKFYQLLQPQHAVISAGNTSHGHPHQEVLDFLGNQGIKVYRTDQEGAMSFYVWLGRLGRFLRPR